jgi:ribosomal protein S18 acetylase RimI-like enzyme
MLVRVTDERSRRPIRRIDILRSDSQNLVTRLLQRARLSHREAGVWEAAEVQWWSRTPRRSDSMSIPVWLDAVGPVAAVLLTDWSDNWAIDVLRVPGLGLDLDAVWAAACDMLNAGAPGRYETLVQTSDRPLIDRLIATGFEPGEPAGEAWMDAAQRAPTSEVPGGYRLVDRTETETMQHPMMARSGSEVERRLRQCSLYEPRLDLAVLAADGSFAGYALFWADPGTSVGVVEPMRVEEAHMRRGLGRAMLTEGLDRLVARGMARLKVGFETDAAQALYASAGFQTRWALRTYATEVQAANPRS